MADISPDLGTGRASVGAALDFAWTATEFTATDMMAHTGVTRSTAIDAIDTLVEARVLDELPNARAAGSYRAGRPARRFALAEDLGVIVGIDAGHAHLAVEVADLALTSLALRRADLDPVASPTNRLATILQTLQLALDDAGTPREKVLAICAGVAAPVDRDGVSPPHREGFWERTNPGLIAALRDWAPAADVKNDATMAAIAEGADGAATGSSDYVALLAGERFGGGVVVDGHVLHGAHGGVGESIVFDRVVGVTSTGGLRSALERGARALVDDGSVAPSSPLAGGSANAREILRLAADGDPDALRVADGVGEMLARIIGVLGSMYDPERVVVCGSFADAIEPVLEATRRYVPDELHLPAPQVVASPLGAEAVTHGALATARLAAREVSVPLLAARRLAA
ncbi:transcriptional regulator [Microbacterium sorbitolivorans]|uniref:ROK family protein n=1 Tax=Microbacterium sorbitolivorans TaxID=1867410 RepID=A0A367XT48_9MICO|nr:ROK family protein [Microbacterium sorbitolivorans]RCK56803.1 ROK family protein [Microbacterium sorbitolivorans]GGF50034.1 transcriptional regulator [Microbacterium sorbitolivorans]